MHPAILSSNLLPILAQSGQVHLNPQAAAAAGAVALVVILIAVAIGLAIGVLICWLISSSVQRIPAQYREMSPGGVWLMLIPLFNIVWIFFVVTRVPNSFKNYFQANGRTDCGDCGKGIGLAYAICALCSIIPMVNFLAAPAALVLLIIFIVKIVGYKGQIAEPSAQTAATTVETN